MTTSPANLEVRIRRLEQYLGSDDCELNQWKADQRRVRSELNNADLDEYVVGNWLPIDRLWHFAFTQGGPGRRGGDYEEVAHLLYRILTNEPGSDERRSALDRLFRAADTGEIHPTGIDRPHQMEIHDHNMTRTIWHALQTTDVLQAPEPAWGWICTEQVRTPLKGGKRPDRPNRPLTE